MMIPPELSENEILEDTFGDVWHKHKESDKQRAIVFVDENEQCMTPTVGKFSPKIEIKVPPKMDQA
jgi:hypothetical protein